MPCLLCGDICRCSSAAHPAASPRWLPEAAADSAPLTPHAEPEPPGVEAPSLGPAPEASAPSHSSASNSNEAPPEDSPAWRQEVAARLNSYQARRRPRPPRYPSLRLRFEEEDPASANGGSAESPAFPQRMTTVSNQALALDAFPDSIAHAAEIPAPGPLASDDTQGPREVQGSAAPTPATAPTTAKILEFPRSWTPSPSPLDELAEPVLDRDRPRILEAPEVVPPLPALGGITIEPAQQPEMEKRPGIDIPLQSAPLARRILSAAIDNAIIASAGALFGFIFWKVTAIHPPRLQMMVLAAGLSGLFWAAYQYLLMVYSGTTPGLRLARLELARFNGSPAGRRLRRWRVLASCLSAASLGMGYVWVFLDEDSLCWHDRITHTYLAPKGHTAAPGNLTG